MAATAQPETPPSGGEEPLTTAVGKDGFVHIDRISFGIYEFPLDMVEVDESAIGEIEAGEQVFRANPSSLASAASFAGRCRFAATSGRIPNSTTPFLLGSTSHLPLRRSSSYL